MIQLIPGWGGAGWGVAGPEADRHSGRGGRVGSSLWARHLYLFRQGAPFTEESQVCRAADRMTSRFPPGSQGLQVYLLPRAADSCPKHPLPVNIPITPNRGCPRTTLRLNVT